VIGPEAPQGIGGVGQASQHRASAESNGRGCGGQGWYLFALRFSPPAAKARVSVGWVNVYQRLRVFGMGSKLWVGAAAEALNMVLEWNDLATWKCLAPLKMRALHEDCRPLTIPAKIARIGGCKLELSVPPARAAAAARRGGCDAHGTALPHCLVTVFPSKVQNESLGARRVEPLFPSFSSS